MITLSFKGEPTCASENFQQDNCVTHPDVKTTGMYQWLEEDISWAVVTFACIPPSTQHRISCLAPERVAIVARGERADK